MQHAKDTYIYIRIHHLRTGKWSWWRATVSFAWAGNHFPSWNRDICGARLNLAPWKSIYCGSQIYVCTTPEQPTITNSPKVADTSSSIPLWTPANKLNVSRSNDSKDGESSAAAVGGSVAGACIAVATVCMAVVLLFIYYKRRKITNRHDESNLGRENGATGMHLHNLNYDGQISDVPKARPSNCNGTEAATRSDELRAGSQAATRAGFHETPQYAYAATFVEGFRPQQTTSAVNSSLVHSAESAESGQIEKESSDIMYEEVYWQPAKSVEKLYAQFDGKRFRRILRSELVIHETIGSG
jgi:hypothetical protein